MKTKKPLSWTTLVLAGLLAILAWATPALLLAQEPDAPRPPRATVERECRCVDADGNEIENCVCIGPQLERVRAMVGSMFRRRAQIGVNIDYGQDEARGAVIQEVMEGSPAEAAGLRAGDVVTHVDGRSLLEPLEDPDAERALDEEESVAVQRFVRLVGTLEPEVPAQFRVLREGSSRTLQVTPEPARGMVVASRVGEAPYMGSYRFFPEGELATAFGFEGDSLRRGMDSLEVRLRRGLEPLREMRWRFEMDDEGGPTIYRFEGGDSIAGFRIQGDSANWMRLRSGEEGPFAVIRGLRADACAELQDGSWPLGGGTCIAGADLIDLNPDLGSYFGTDEGVLVAQVAEGATLGLRAGDVILSIGTRDVRSARQAVRILQSYTSDEEIRMRVLREGNEREVLGRRR